MFELLQGLVELCIEVFPGFVHGLFIGLHGVVSQVNADFTHSVTQNDIANLHFEVFVEVLTGLFGRFGGVGVFALFCESGGCVFGVWRVRCSLVFLCGLFGWGSMN